MLQSSDRGQKELVRYMSFVGVFEDIFDLPTRKTLAYSLDLRMKPWTPICTAIRTTNLDWTMTASEKACCIRECGKTRKVTVLHLFPNPYKDNDRYAAWIQAVEMDPLLEQGFVYQNRRVCHEHFEQKYKTGSGRLICNAVPTLFLPGSKTAPIPPTEITNSPERSLLDTTCPSRDSKIAQIPPTEITNGPEKSLLDTTFPSTSTGCAVRYSGSVVMAPPKKLIPELLPLIEEVKQQPVIWNREHKFYNIKNYSATAWKQISKNLGIPEALIRAKWKSLRSIFTREMKRSNAKTIEGYNGQWQYFDTLKFLSDNIQMGTDDEQEQTVQINIKKEIPDSNSQTDLFVDTNNICNGSFQQPKPKKRRVADEDYDVMFLKSLTPYFKEFDAAQKLIIKTKLQDLLLNEIAAQNSI